MYSGWCWQGFGYLHCSGKWRVSIQAPPVVVKPSCLCLQKGTTGTGFQNWLQRNKSFLLRTLTFISSRSTYILKWTVYDWFGLVWFHLNLNLNFEAQTRLTMETKKSQAGFGRNWSWKFFLNESISILAAKFGWKSFQSHKIIFCRLKTRKKAKRIIFHSEKIVLCLVHYK